MIVVVCVAVEIARQTLPQQRRSGNRGWPSYGSLPVSESCDALFDAIAEGDSSVTGAHRIAAALVEEGVASDAVRTFASCGDHGLNTNIERDMHRRVSDMYGFQIEFDELEILVKDEFMSVPELKKIPIAAPWVLLEQLWTAQRNALLVFFWG